MGKFKELRFAQSSMKFNGADKSTTAKRIFRAIEFMRTSISQKTTNVTPRYREVNFLTVNCGKKLLESTVTLQFVPQECSFSDMKII
ncbi:hypothetical protein M514_00972, partial [Trichuris suis]